MTAFSQDYHIVPRQDTVINGVKYFLDPKKEVADDGIETVIYERIDSSEYVRRVWRDTEQAAIVAGAYHTAFLSNYLNNRQAFGLGNQILMATTGRNFYQLQGSSGTRNNFEEFTGTWVIVEGDTSVTIVVDSTGLGRQVQSVDNKTLVPQGKRIRFLPQAPGYSLLRDVSTVPLIFNGQTFEAVPLSGRRDYITTQERTTQEGVFQVRKIYRYVDWLNGRIRIFKFDDWQTI